MQAAGNLIATAAKFAARMQHRERDLKGALVQFGMLIHRDAAAIVRNGQGIVLVDVDLNVVAESAHGFIDGVVHQLLDQVVQPAHIG